MLIMVSTSQPPGLRIINASQLFSRVGNEQNMTLFRIFGGMILDPNEDEILEKHGKTILGTLERCLLYLYNTPNESCSFVFIDRKPEKLRHCEYDRMKSVAHKVG